MYNIQFFKETLIHGQDSEGIKAPWNNYYENHPQMCCYRDHHPGTAAMEEIITDNENTDNQ